jgi:polysaccharide deacetylase family sporulation protein PdaB
MLIFCIFVSSYFTQNAVETAANTSRLLPIYSVETDDKKVALTFDCAWGASDIPAIIDVLEKNNVKATFFLVGTWIDEYSEEVKMIADKGHDIGNHSDSHAHVSKLSYEANLDDMRKCNKKIEEITGQGVTLYRGPYGEYSNNVISAAKELYMFVIHWDVDTLDYTDKTPDEMCDRIKSKIRNGSIILMHNDTKYTASGLQQIIDEVQSLGYTFEKVSNLIYTEDYKINHEGRQQLYKTN